MGGFVAVVVFVAVLMWASPLSPAALGQADLALGLGSAEVAASRYDRISEINPFPWVRDEALYRGAMVYAFDLDDAIAARSRLEKLARREGEENPRYAEIEAQIGQLLMRGDGVPDEAARAYIVAFEAAPKAPEAADRLISAARAYRESGDLEAADKAWKRVQKRFPERSVDAMLGRAELFIAKNDPKGALDMYEMAIPLADTPDELALARLGAATCLERLGDVEGALAEIDGPELPEDMVQSRREALRARLQGNGAEREAEEAPPAADAQ